MMCWKDRQFCASDCRTSTCPRFFGEKQRKEAEAWWGGPDAPVAFADMSGGCKDYSPGGEAPFKLEKRPL